MTRLSVFVVAFLLAVHGQQALAQEKDKAKPKAPEQALPNDVADWNTKQLLEHYDPAESDNKVGRELEKRGKDKRFIVFNKDRTVDVKSSEFLFKEVRKGFAERQWYEVGGTLAKTYKVGVQPEELLDENPLYPGEALRLDGTCDHTKRKWTGVPLITRQVLYLAITDSKELKISKVGDAHDILDKLKGKNAADSESWLKERYPQAYQAYGEKKDRNQLPILKISSDKLKSGATQKANTVDLLALVEPAQHSVKGRWMFQDGALVSDTSTPAKLQIPYLPGEDYVLRLSVERKQYAGAFAIGLVVDKTQVLIVIDSFKSVRKK